VFPLGVHWTNSPGRAEAGWYAGRPFGGVAQLVERYVRNVEVGGSSPLTSTPLVPQRPLLEPVVARGQACMHAVSRNGTLGQPPANNVRVVACRVVEMLTVEIEGCRASHARLAARIAGLTDEVVREPSLLPAWSVGHVLTHLARNAEAMFHRIEATTRGEVIDQYVGGAEGRASEIESGAGRPANVLIYDVISWSQRLDATFVSLPDDSWNRPVRSGRGDEHPVARLPFHRWWEVEVHLVDLAIGHTPADWPQELVDRALPRLVAGLANRAEPRSLMAWTLGRGPAPGLESWI
jgi:maleylpyruvate isomerase